MAEVELPDDPTVPRSTWEANPPDRLPPPPRAGARGDRPPFIPYDVAPRLRNEREVARLLERLYPRSLKAAGIDGTVVLWIYVTERGRVAESLVKESSGHGPLDAAARRVASEMVFEPAMSRDRRTGVWVSQHIAFEVR